MKIISLLSYLKNQELLNDYWYDCLRYELDKHVYYYGSHFKRPAEDVLNSKNEKRKYALKLFAAEAIGKLPKKKLNKLQPAVISNAYFNYNEELTKTGFKVIQPPWTNNRSVWRYYNKNLVSLCIKIKSGFECKDFNYILSKDFFDLLEEFRLAFKNFIVEENIKALIVPNDESFFNNISIKIFKESGLKTFVSSHGLPGRYNKIDECRSDYLIVWGNKLKEMYIQNGMPENKIFISGHPSYQNLDKKKNEFSLDNILLITKTIAGSPHSTGVTLTDRGNLITYLLMIKQILQQFNIQKVRFRPHPSENAEWYMRFLDKDFFIPDRYGLVQSIKEASLIIGPVSSVFLEALYYQTNYLVFEPLFDNKNILNNYVPPPFNGFDERIPVAYNNEDLIKFIQEKKCIDRSILSDYYHPYFNIDFIKQLIL